MGNTLKRWWPKRRINALLQNVLAQFSIVPFSVLHLGTRCAAWGRLWFSSTWRKDIQTLDFAGTWFGEGREVAILYAHGGGYVFGVANQGVQLFEPLLTDRVGALSVEYTLCNANQACTEFLSAYQWLRAQKGVQRVVFMGVSAGGHLVLEAAQKLAEDPDGLPPPDGIVAISPWVQPGCTSPNPEALDYVTPAKMEECFNLSKPRPLLGSDWSQLPPTLVIYGGLEYLRVQIETLLEELVAGGVDVTRFCMEYSMHVMPFLIHPHGNAYKTLRLFVAGSTA